MPSDAAAPSVPPPPDDEAAVDGPASSSPVMGYGLSLLMVIAATIVALGAELKAGADRRTDLPTRHIELVAAYLKAAGA